MMYKWVSITKSAEKFEIAVNVLELQVHRELGSGKYHDYGPPLRQKLKLVNRRDPW